MEISYIVHEVLDMLKIHTERFGNITHAHTYIHSHKTQKRSIEKIRVNREDKKEY